MALIANPGSTLDPNAALSSFIQAWKNQQQQQAEDLRNLADAIITMRNMLNSGNVQEAFQFAGMVVMTQSMTCVGDNTGQFAGVENLGTGIRNIVGDLQNIFNGGYSASQSETDAQQFTQWLNEFYNNAMGGGNRCPTWMNSADYRNIVNSLNSIYSEFGATPGNMNTREFINQMGNFFPKTQRTAPQQAVTALQGDFHTLNNSVSALSSSATASEQYWANVYNQAQGVTNNIFQSICSLNTNSIANEKTN